ncbi:type I restriction-modification system subunit M [Mycoplasmoides pneumoniae]|uniref:type I restriction-modification system subunit M n=1 Tax=Mycoplasmoides pneumoniae TaxID=2104 RepID=UPI0036F23139
MEKKRTEQRNGVEKKIWEIADKLRGTIDGWDFKSYVLIGLFYRFLSENLCKYFNDSERRNNPDFSYENLTDDYEAIDALKDAAIASKGFFIKPSQLFQNVVKSIRENKNNEDLNTTLRDIFDDIEKSTELGDGRSKESFKGLFKDFNVSEVKLGSTLTIRTEKLKELLTSIDTMEFDEFEKNSIDAFGDAYEFLISMYAQNAGKSGGEFFTPQDVSELLARIAIGKKDTVDDVYDMACGSGSLLLQVIKVLGKEKTSLVSYYGQEINHTTYNLCRMNMILHNIDYANFNIINADTLTTKEWEKHYVNCSNENGFEVVVSNPPYSISWAGDKKSNLVSDVRFKDAGTLAPNSKADLAFVLHALYVLGQEGTAAIVCFPGILYREGKEQTIRKYLVDQNFVDAVIQLPSNLFSTTSIATSILVLKKNRDKKDPIFFIDGSNEFVREKKNNRLSPKNIEKIVDCFNSKKEEANFAKSVERDKIRESNYDLTVGKYVNSEAEKEELDIKVLNHSIDEIVDKQKDLRTKIKDIIQDIKVDFDNIDINN